ncbi:hypothetical protein HPB47_004208 [Ixodes persulcatus]|uniref:Uncharacterized protein n=1 Tax=Ixodes persulcatus TaxID=34615 RepID=A0AC60PGE3_IXOPE|nr:hypothetical protein HPB47_004208 [Ixodes persulcatus]
MEVSFGVGILAGVWTSPRRQYLAALVPPTKVKVPQAGRADQGYGPAGRRTQTRWNAATGIVRLADQGLRFGDAALPDTPGSLLTVSRSSRTDVSAKRVLELAYTLRPPACTFSRSSHNESSKISEQERKAFCYFSDRRSKPEADGGAAVDTSRRALHSGHARPRVFAFSFGVSDAPKVSSFGVPEEEEWRKLWDKDLHRAGRTLDENSAAASELHFETHYVTRDYVRVISGEEVRVQRFAFNGTRSAWETNAFGRRSSYDFSESSQPSDEEDSDT